MSAVGEVSPQSLHRTTLRAQNPFSIVGAIIDRLRETNSLPYKHSFLLYAYGTPISLIMREEQAPPLR